MSKSQSQFLTDTLKAFGGTFVYRESISFCENQTNNVSRTQTYGPGGQNGAVDRATGHIRAPGPSVPSEPVGLFTSTQKGLQWETSSPEGVQTLGFRRSYFQRLLSTSFTILPIHITKNNSTFTVVSRFSPPKQSVTASTLNRTAALSRGEAKLVSRRVHCAPQTITKESPSE